MYLNHNPSPTAMECIGIIQRDVPTPDLFEQLAEEAAELAQAANKMARAIRRNNPTPKTEDEAMKDVIEEYTDVVSVGSNILDIEPDWLIGDYKLYRWTKRIEENSRSEQGV